MPNTGMGESHLLDTNTITYRVPQSIGAYALGSQGSKLFTVLYIGRSDVNLRDRLLQHVGERYTHFKFMPIYTQEDAFYKECHLYHDFGENSLLDNKEHPARPVGTDYQCPRCTIFNLSTYI